MRSQHVPSWQQHPAYLVTHQYSRCLERLLGALPMTVQRQTGPALIVAIARMRAGLAAVQPQPERVFGPVALGPDSSREAGLRAVAGSVAALELMRRERLAPRAEILVALELLERIEAGLR
jgi:hypothetical protein